MFARFIFWFKNLFGSEDNDYSPDYTDVKKMKPSRYNTEPYLTARTYDKRTQTQTHTLSSSSQKKQSSSSHDYVPSKEALMKQIKSNIFFLEQLQELLSLSDNYLSYQKKVLSMMRNSHNSHKIISRLRDDAPYYQNTMEMIYRHTKSISIILETST